MIKVEQTAKTLDEGIKNLMAGAKLDYERWSSKSDGISEWSKEQIAQWDNKTKISQGKKYIKIVQDTGVFCFIAKEDFDENEIDEKGNLEEDEFEGDQFY